MLPLHMEALSYRQTFWTPNLPPRINAGAVLDFGDDLACLGIDHDGGVAAPREDLGLSWVIAHRRGIRLFRMSANRRFVVGSSFRGDAQSSAHQGPDLGASTALLNSKTTAPEGAAANGKGHIFVNNEGKRKPKFCQGSRPGRHDGEVKRPPSRQVRGRTGARAPVSNRNALVVVAPGGLALHAGFQPRSGGLFYNSICSNMAFVVPQLDVGFASSSC